VPTPSLSKSRFLNGLQCHKRLWWQVHEPEAEELQVDEVLQATFDAGTRVGELARAHIGPGIHVDAPPWELATRLTLTQQALETGATRIFEASFEHGGVFAAVDGLEVTPQGMRLLEVKSTTKLKEEHLPDIAIQRWVLEGAGHRVAAAELIHVNRECRAPDLSNLFARDDVTEATAELQENIAPEVAAQLKMLTGPCPEVEVGPHCTKPYDCPFIDRCWKDVPKHHVGTLMNISPKKRADFQKMGVAEIDQIPLDYELTPRQEVQRRAVRAGTLWVGREVLAAELRAYDVDRIAFLDFETVAEAVPVWEGCHPFDQIPVQMSCHVQARDGTVTHHAWIASGPEDPRPECARQVAAACQGADIVVVWHASMEKGCLERLILGAPSLAQELLAVIAQLVDLKKVVEAGVYHPDFLGSYSLKPVVQSLLPPEWSYGRLAVGEGMLASVRLRRLMFEGAGIASAERDRMREELLTYCGHDTLVMVELLKKLRTLAT
jgi:uncharacterized protein DUF2779